MGLTLRAGHCASSRRKCGGRGLVLIIAITMALFSDSSVRGQDIGSVAPRTIVIKAFDAVSCAPHTFVVPDGGLNTHMMVYTTAGVINSIEAGIEGSFDDINYVSVTPVNSFLHPVGSNFAKIYMPFIRMRIYACNGTGTITAWYSGTWALDPFFPFPQAFTPFPCVSSAPLNLTGAGTSVVVASTSTTKQIHICHISFALSAASNATFKFGTGVNCGNGTGSLTGAYQSILSLVFNFGEREQFAPPVGNDLCITLSAATTLGGYVDYAEF